ncbi:hypothetical protein C8R45DRAFT_1082138 [Mycena sanguinolenta]|nr:hypothetical protein C8R45DRAFT_1082138 [Mycena sanguinolenta]
MRRSRSCPLSIEIDSCDHDLFSEVFTETMTMAVTRSEYLQLWSPSHSHPRLGRMPLLRSLALSVGPTDEIVTYDAPQLHTVVLCRDSISNVALPWAQLTCLTLIYVAINPCISVLRQTTNLVRCELVFQDELLDFFGPDLSLPYLEFLTLKTTLQQTDGFLIAFVVPTLHRLDLEEMFLGVEQPILALERFIAKSGCRLREVLIRGGNTEQGDLYRRAFPFISISYIRLADPWYKTTDSEDDSEAEDNSEAESE